MNKQTTFAAATFDSVTRLVSRFQATHECSELISVSTTKDQSGEGYVATVTYFCEAPAESEVVEYVTVSVAANDPYAEFNGKRLRVGKTLSSGTIRVDADGIPLYLKIGEFRDRSPEEVVEYVKVKVHATHPLAKYSGKAFRINTKEDSGIISVLAEIYGGPGYYLSESEFETFKW